ncbi:MAG: cupin domain-containing protein [Schleiferiaceae bacterium]|jgi:mannose-6-phosphate isomerase-like protein (cupin superfamily)|nr:cupin domain-containing protein [Schleiferiaceae bacterium]
MKKVNLKEKFNLISEYWSPKIVGELNGQLVKLAKMSGEFVMHQHDNEDELFFVVKGKLEMHYEDSMETIKAGEFVIVPKGVLHKPIVHGEAEVLLFEPSTTLNTGNLNNDLTQADLDRI